MVEALLLLAVYELVTVLGCGLGLGVGGVSLYFRSCLTRIINLERSTLPRAPISLACELVWSLIQRNSGVTMYSSPKYAALAATRFNAFTGVKNGDLSNGCTINSGEMVTLTTATMPYVTVASGCLAVPGPVVDRALLSSNTVGVVTSQTIIHYNLTFTVVGR